MPKWKTNYDSGRKYKSEWEKDFPWVTKSASSEEAFCKLCKKNIVPKKANLESHQQSQSHLSRVQLPPEKTSCFKSFFKASDKSTELKTAEIQFAVSVACHCSILAIDHIGEIIQKSCKCHLSNLKLHRTKCTKIISNVVAKSLTEELKKDVKGQPFSLMVDESTDCSSEKLLCVCIRYFSDAKAEIVTAFLSLIPVNRTTGEALFDPVKKCLEEYKLDLCQCIGFASDGANNMIGERNSLWSRIKESNPNCIQLKCICHSLALQQGIQQVTKCFRFPVI